MDIFGWHSLFAVISAAAGIVGALAVMAVPVRWRIRPDTLLVMVFLLAVGGLIVAEVTGNRPGSVTFAGWFTGEQGKTIGITMFALISIFLVGFLYWATTPQRRRTRRIPYSHRYAPVG